MRIIDSVKRVDVRAVLALLLVSLLLGCSSPTRLSDAQAQRTGLIKSIERGTQFRHVIYARVEQPVRTLRVFLEGDGVPWVGGRIPAKDPTSRNPLALQLMIQSHGPALYVGRPCYHEMRDSECSAHIWTFARYSQAVVESMASVIEAQSQRLGATSIELIGYSGGGVLAVLIAEQLPNVASVVTIAANLDIDAWAEHHGYLPLTHSLNPARSTTEHRWTETHFLGARDARVPIATTRSYFERYPNARRIVIDEYDHVCCWVRDWAALAP